MKKLLLGLSVALAAAAPVVAQDIAEQNEIIVPSGAPPQAVGAVAALDDYKVNPRSDRATFFATRGQRGTSQDIPERRVIELCGDRDGCSVRIGMHNWDDTGRVASRETLLYYNRRNKVWRAEAGDTAGTNENNVTEHVIQAWACYLTDGRYENWGERRDSDATFGVLSWNQYNADCFVVLVD